MYLCERKSPPHPCDGPWAWLVCFSCFTINFLVYGMILSFGVLLPVFMEEFHTSKGVTAWIGSLAMGVSFLCVPVGSRIVNILSERTVGFCCGLIAAALLFGGSYTKHIAVLFFTNGIIFGFLISCVVASLTKSFQKYFKKHIGLASGITTSGGSLGVLVFTPLMQFLVDSLEWRSTLKILSITVAIAGFACLSFHQNVEGCEIVEKEGDDELEEDQPTRRTARQGGHIDCSVWRSPKYIIGVVCIFLNFLCLYVPLVHMITFARDRGIPPSKSSLLFIYTGSCSTVFRILSGKIVDHKWLTPLQCIQLSSYIVGLSLLLFTMATKYYHFVLIILCYAVGNGIFAASQYLFLFTCFDDKQKNYVGLGVCYTITAFALLSGSPIAGFVADIFNSYVPSFYIFGGLIIFSGTLPFLLLFIKDKQPRSVIDVRMDLIGSRLANMESSLLINV